MQSVQYVIDRNIKFLDDVNQILHNAGVLFESRIHIMLELIHGAFVTTPVDVRQKLLGIMETVTVSKEELFQKVFMFYGSKYLKKEFDQFYTPLTIGEFLCNLCEPGRTMIDPACGTGDLAIHYNGCVSLWDISKDVIDLTRENYKFQGKSATILAKDSILDISDSQGTFDYAVVNPPFGTKTLVTDASVLNNYILGKGKKKQEVGILFVERSMQILKPDGLLFIILPNGYFGNTSTSYVELRNFILQYRVAAILKLPQNTFKRSGTGVSTNILIVSKSTPVKNYDIFIEEVDEIGYDLNKKNTPYKYRKKNSEYVLDSMGRPILHNTLHNTLERFKTFAGKNGIPNIPKCTTSDTSYQVVNTRSLDNTRTLDISRYLGEYTGIVSNNANKIRIRDILEPEYVCSFTKVDSKEYVYLDIKEINTPIHNGKILLGYDLPSRAKYSVAKNDILVSRLKGSIAFTVILEDTDNIVCTNGVCVLRPKDAESMLVLFANLFSPDFKIQQRALTTGSIMESISDDDMKDILVTRDIDRTRYQRILDSIAVLQTELPK
jgi:type I restriction enzyme M protein